MIKLDKKTILHKCRIAFKKRWLVVGSIALFSILVLCLANLDRFEFGKFSNWLTKDESGSATIRNIGLLVLAVVGMPFAIWRSVVAGRQADIAQRGLRNERYQKAVEMLGDGILAVRLGGIYALQVLAKEDPKWYHIQVMKIFSAFLRQPKAIHQAEVTRTRSLRSRTDLSTKRHYI